jgi:hypothetical protein
MLALALCLIRYANTSLRRVESGDISLLVLKFRIGEEWSPDVVALCSGKDTFTVDVVVEKKIPVSLPHSAVQIRFSAVFEPLT